MSFRTLAEMGELLKGHRQARGLTLREVERRTNSAISFSLLQKVEQGYVDASLMRMAALANLYGLSLDELVRRDG